MVSDGPSLRGFAPPPPAVLPPPFGSAQNKRSPNFSNFRPECCSESGPEFSPNFARSFSCFFSWETEIGKIEWGVSRRSRGVSNGGVSRSGLVPPFLSGIFRFARGWSGDFPDSSPFLFLGLLRAPTRNSPRKGLRLNLDLSRKKGKPPGLETPRFSFCQEGGFLQY